MLLICTRTYLDIHLYIAVDEKYLVRTIGGQSVTVLTPKTIVRAEHGVMCILFSFFNFSQVRM